MLWIKFIRREFDSFSKMEITDEDDQGKSTNNNSWFGQNWQMLFATSAMVDVKKRKNILIRMSLNGEFHRNIVLF